MEPFFSIIIPTLNEEYNLPILLSSISKQTFKGFEVIVNDSGSHDSTEEKALQYSSLIPGLRFIKHPTKNVSGARNNGAHLAKAPWLIFFDSDVELSDTFLEEIKKHIEEKKLDMLTVWNRPKTKNITGITTLALLNFSMTVLERIRPAANGPCIIIKKELFEKIGRFDETIVFGEDFDITQKAYKQHARFAVFSHPILYVSARRFEKEGFFPSIGKSLKAVFYQMFKGPIREPIFEYEMGGQYFREQDQTK